MTARIFEFALWRAGTLLVAAGALASALTSPFALAADPAPAEKTRPPLIQRTFATPEDAAKALAEAMGSENRGQLWQILGPGASKLIRSGDPVQDDDARKAF